MKVKKVYLLNCECEHYTPLTTKIDLLMEDSFSTRKSAQQTLKNMVKYCKRVFKEELNDEKKQGNTMTIDLYCYVYDETKGFSWGLIKYDLVDSRYLCGRY